MRSALEPCLFHRRLRVGRLIHFVKRGLIGSLATVTPDDLVETDKDLPLYTLTRGQETELPALGQDHLHQRGEGLCSKPRSRHGALNVRSDRVSAAELPDRHAPEHGAADRRILAARCLGGARAGELRPAAVAARARAIRLITLEAGGRDYRLRLTETSDGHTRASKLARSSPGLRGVARAGAAG